MLFMFFTPTLMPYTIKFWNMSKSYAFKWFWRGNKNFNQGFVGSLHWFVQVCKQISYQSNKNKAVNMNECESKQIITFFREYVVFSCLFFMFQILSKLFEDIKKITRHFIKHFSLDCHFSKNFSVFYNFV